jgi:hypothetical protein
MDIQKIELMRALQREYYREVERNKGWWEKGCGYGVHVSPQMLYFYRLCTVGFLGFLLPAIVTIVIRLFS